MSDDRVRIVIGRHRLAEYSDEEDDDVITADPQVWAEYVRADRKRADALMALRAAERELTAARDEIMRGAGTP